MKRQFAIKVCTSLLLVMFSTTLFSDSIWDNSSGPFYGVSKRKVRVGDVITVLISESASAAQEATTQTQKDSTIGTRLVDNWDQVANLLGNETIRKTFNLSINGNDNYKGSGGTTRRSNVRAVVTSIVTEVMETGNLFIVGEHEVKVNNEVETIRVSGIIRPQDITAQNTVLSSQVAKVEVSVNGSGVVASKQSPGILTKMFNWLF